MLLRYFCCCSILTNVNIQDLLVKFYSIVSIHTHIYIFPPRILQYRPALGSSQPLHACVFALFHCLCCSACVVTVALRTKSSPDRAVLGCSQGVYSSCLYSVVCPPPRKRLTVISSPPNRWKHAWKILPDALLNLCLHAD